jgi:predicted metal-dependent hydrolase
MIETLQVHDLTFELRRSSKRKSIAIIIDRRGELILSVPQECPREYVQRTAEEKYRWIYTRLAKKEMLFRPPRPKEFLTGESFSYLGHPYRLQLVPVSHYDHDTPPLQFQAGWFLLREDERAHAWEHFSRWYGEQGYSWLEQRVGLFVDRIGVRPQGINIQDIGYRWGSCSRSQMLNFHWRVIQLPPMIIDYLVVHELVHLHERSHNTDFWRCVEQALPDFAERKEWLAENGSQF